MIISFHVISCMCLAHDTYEMLVYCVLFGNPGGSRSGAAGSGAGETGEGAAGMFGASDESATSTHRRRCFPSLQPSLALSLSFSPLSFSLSPPFSPLSLTLSPPFSLFLSSHLLVCYSAVPAPNCLQGGPISTPCVDLTLPYLLLWYICVIHS
jgi:hypothetical protein